MAKKTYKYRKGFIRPSASAEAVAKELKRIESKNGGRLTPIDVLDHAKTENNILHDAFQWDDSKAAQAHRLWQARSLIRGVIIVEQKQEAPLYNNVIITSEGSKERHYVPITAIKADEHLYQQAKKVLMINLKAAQQSIREIIRLGERQGFEVRNEHQLNKLIDRYHQRNQSANSDMKPPSPDPKEPPQKPAV